MVLDGALRQAEAARDRRALAPAGPGQGPQDLRTVRMFAGRRLASRNRFMAFEPRRYVKFEIPSGWVSGAASYRAETDGSAGTVLTCRMEFGIRGLFSLLEPVLARLLAKDSRHHLQRLKRLLENDDQPGPVASRPAEEVADAFVTRGARGPPRPKESGGAE